MDFRNNCFQFVCVALDRLGNGGDPARGQQCCSGNALAVGLLTTAADLMANKTAGRAGRGGKAAGAMQQRESPGRLDGTSGVHLTCQLVTCRGQLGRQTEPLTAADQSSCSPAAEHCTITATVRMQHGGRERDKQ